MQRSLTYSYLPSTLETTDTSALRPVLPIIRTSPHSHPPYPKVAPGSGRRCRQFTQLSLGCCSALLQTRPP